MYWGFLPSDEHQYQRPQMPMAAAQQPCCMGNYAVMPSPAPALYSSTDSINLSHSSNTPSSLSGRESTNLSHSSNTLSSLNFRESINSLQSFNTSNSFSFSESFRSLKNFPETENNSAGPLICAQNIATLQKSGRTTRKRRALKENLHGNTRESPGRPELPSILAICNGSPSVTGDREISPKKGFVLEIAGKLTALAASHYPVTVGELKRRVGAPEYLNRSSLAQLLRKGKLKGCGDDLSVLLHQHQIFLTVGSKKGFTNTFTGLLEDEAIVFAKDSGSLLDAYFPRVAFARVILARKLNLQTHTHALLQLKVFGDEMLALHGILVTKPEALFKDSIHHSLSPYREFSLVTHCFGVIEFQNFAECVRKYAEDALEACEVELVKIHRGVLREDEVTIARQFNDSYHLISETPVSAAALAEFGQRRLSSPECLNASLLRAILRRAKSSSQGLNIRATLDQHGINLAAGIRKAKPTTSFTVLLEEEAVQLAMDLSEACRKYFRVDDFARRLNALNRPTDQMLIQRRSQMLRHAEMCLEELVILIESIDLPVKNHTPIDRTHLQPLLAPYSLITHGFGIIELATFFRLFARIAKAAYDNLPML